MSRSALTLDLARAYWLPSLGPVLGPREDLCAHGDIVLAVGPESEEAEGMCVSAAALNLLRTLERDHTPEAPVAANLLPHCGHWWFVTEGEGLVNGSDCPGGLDLAVRHRDGDVVVTAASGAEAEVTEREWADVVRAFAAGVERLYEEAGPKEVKEDDREWYEAFWREWRERLARAAASA